MTPPSKWVGRWLVAWAIALFLLVLIGGGTRLTESGLSITEWNPIAGVVPPMSDAAWADAFARYKEIPQGKLNAAMTLEQFRAIYWWEFIHRFWARLVGIIGIIPWLWFFYRGRLSTALAKRCAQIVALIGVQGALGWYMVASGLTQRTEVSQYRLAAHLTLAIVIYLLTVWTAAGVRKENSEFAAVGHRPSVQVTTLVVLAGLVGLTAVSGAFVAGLRAGKIYNTFPLMGAGLVPPEYGQLSPAWKNPFENPAAAQFDHRVLAMLTFVAVVAVWWRLRARAAPRLRARLDLVLGAAILQVALGVATLLRAVPVALGVAHQGGALLLLTALVLAIHAARVEPAI